MLGLVCFDQQDHGFENLSLFGTKFWFVVEKGRDLFEGCSVIIIVTDWANLRSRALYLMNRLTKGAGLVQLIVDERLVQVVSLKA
ncbi:hypothetical protein BGP84_12850 [Pseudomonas putida]|uniref:Uncharacterized protein n=1 Tax=Pseudomonas putida TaxID=303 RepID=A0A2S3X4R7_PSEPU|nr:hypothetical protein [Pseudomonas putida]POG10566.1 hypothetical protein BGP84_12850 [Pseudomonas putida]POG16710.1 hypothetical protein BGP85_11355 [Pseudomonas putida]